jgi:glutamate/tyrosine decarboxylase-like PLP-dependent enzyme
MHDALAEAAACWESWDVRIRERPVTPVLTNDALAARLAPYDFEAPRDLRALTRDVADFLEQGSLHPTHPRYFGLFVPGVRAAGVVADTLAAAYNPQLGAWWHGPAAAHVEQRTLAFFRDRIGLPASSFATFTTGGSEANLTGVLAGLAAAFPQFARDGLGGVRATLYVSDQAHDSFVKIARTVGLGERAVRRVPSDARQRMDVPALERTLADDRAAGRVPFLVVATVGTTATGAVDPLRPLADLCARESLWLHADAAWGGIALLSDALRGHVAGVECADSITWDAHKTMPVPMGAGMFFVRDRRFTEAVFSVRTGYVPSTEPGTFDAYQQTLQWSRRFIGLKVFMTLAELGRRGLAHLVDRQTEMGDRLRDALRAEGWTIANHTPLPLVCFTRPDIGPEETSALVRRVVGEGDVWISEVRLPDGARWLRACITHHEVDASDLRALTGALARARAGAFAT